MRGGGTACTLRRKFLHGWGILRSRRRLSCQWMESVLRKISATHEPEPTFSPLNKIFPVEQSAGFFVQSFERGNNFRIIWSCGASTGWLLFKNCCGKVKLLTKEDKNNSPSHARRTHVQKFGGRIRRFQSVSVNSIYDVTRNFFDRRSV